MISEESRDSGEQRAFYAPATYQFSAARGRVERALARAFRRRGEMTGRPGRPHPVREFYAPATFQFSGRPGRVERFLTRAVRQRGAMDGHPRPDPTEYAFYAPASTRSAHARRGKRPEAR